MILDTNLIVYSLEAISRTVSLIAPRFQRDDPVFLRARGGDSCIHLWWGFDLFILIFDVKLIVLLTRISSRSVLAIDPLLWCHDPI